MPPTQHPGSLAAQPGRVRVTAIADVIENLGFGAVVLTVHDGKLIQMDVTERQRFS